MTETRYNPGLHRVALLTAAATFPLIFMGGLVTSHGAGMSVPDWPNSYGYNMFTFPPSQWLGRQAGGIFYEHSHRLMGSVVGMLSIVLAVWAWATERRRWVKWLATGVLAAVILQGVLGGLRVVLVELDLAVVHACFAQAFFCLAALAVVVTSRWWVERPASPPPPCHPERSEGPLVHFREGRQGSGPAWNSGAESGIPGPIKVPSAPVENAREVLRCAQDDRGAVADSGTFRLAAALVAIVYLQLVVGALMRHYGAGLAIPDLPLAYGKVLPPASGAGLELVNEARRWDAGLPGVSLAQVWLHFGHRIGAVLVTVASVALVARVIRRHRTELTWGAVVLSALLMTQVTLGVLTVLWRKPADVASLHVAVGALVLVTAFVMSVRAARVNYLVRQCFVPSPLYSGERVRVRGSSSDGAKTPLTPALSPEYRGEGVSLSTN